MSEQHVKGLADLQKFLDQLTPKMEANVMRGALRAGVRPIKDAAVALCPVGPPSTTGAKRYKLYEGALRDSIRISAKMRKGVVTATVRAGGKLSNGADVWYAHMIEFSGSIAHIIKAKKGGALAIGGGLYKSVEHPGMPAQPFMRPAMDSQAQSAVVAAGEYIKRRLATKEGLDTSGIEIEAGQ